MNWKLFFRPSKRKVITTIIVYAIVNVLYYPLFAATCSPYANACAARVILVNALPMLLFSYTTACVIYFVKHILSLRKHIIPASRSR